MQTRQRQARWGTGACSPRQTLRSRVFLPRSSTPATRRCAKEARAIRSRAVLVAIGIDWEGQCRILGVELASRDERQLRSWREFLLGLKARGLDGVRLGYQRPPSGSSGRAIAEAIPGNGPAARCYVHFLCNALDHLPSQRLTTIKPDRTALALRPPGRRRSPSPSASPGWSAGAANIPSSVPGSKRVSKRPGPSLSLPPRALHKHLKSTNLLERPNQELKPPHPRRAHLSPTMPVACALIRALACGTTLRNGSTGPP